MIPIPSGVRVWIATGHTDMRRGMQGLALTVQESLKRDPHAGDLYIFRGRLVFRCGIEFVHRRGPSTSVSQRSLKLAVPSDWNSLPP
jgi:transposase